MRNRLTRRPRGLAAFPLLLLLCATSAPAQLQVTQRVAASGGTAMSSSGCGVSGTAGRVRTRRLVLLK